VNKGRLEAFSDGVIAIILTIMVLELHVPAHHAQLGDLKSVAPVFASYVLSFVNVGIYWNNHHHLLHATKRVDAAVQWANLHLLFWLSLMPFTTGWMGENEFAPTPTAIYGLDLLLCSLAYFILQREIIKEQGPGSIVARAVGTDLKGKISPAAYVLAIPLAFVSQWIAGALYVGVALMWLIPDRRIARALADHAEDA
jgi:uncharacterized membrane protein